MEETSFYLPGKTGELLHFLQAGPVRTPTWIFLHGYGDGAYVWRHAMGNLSVSHSLLAVDLPGHGRSYRVASGEYSTAHMVEDLAMLLRARRRERFALIGHSWGGLVAIHLAAAFPEQIAGLVIVDANPEENRDAVEHVGRHLKWSLRTYGSSDEYARWLLSRLPLASLSTVWDIAKQATKPRADGLVELWLDPALAERAPTGGEIWGLLPRIQAPVLFIRGGLSGIVSAAVARETVKRLSRAELRTVSRAGHAVMIDNPSGFLSTLVPFIREIEDRESAETEFSNASRDSA